ncbi:LysR family transcriptional regulator, partial [Streptomyces sp. Act-28]
MVHEYRPQPRLSLNGNEEEMGLLLAPRLAYFAAVARHEHVTRAAEETGVPQSTLSRAVARLERDLGVTLFARKGRALSLTPAGRTFLLSVERALGEVERAAEAVRADVDPTAGRVAFGFLHTMGSETVPGLLRAFRVDHPKVRFTLVQNYGEAMIERLRAGELDLCLTSPVPDAPDLVARRLDEQRLRLVVPDDHRLAGRKRIRLAEAADEAFVTLEPGYGLRRITDDLCAEAGFRPRIAFEGEEAETLRGLVAAG